MSWTESHGRSMFGKYNLTKLELDQAWLNITNFSKLDLSVFQLSKDCHECPFVKTSTPNEYGDYITIPIIKSGESTHFIVDTKFPLTYRLQTTGTEEYVFENDTRNRYCQVETSMGEFGVYEMTATEGNNCNVKTALGPVSIFLPFLIPIFFYLGLGIIIVLLQKYRNHITKLFKKPEPEPTITTIQGTVGSPKLNEVAVAAAPSRPRLRSLDTFRGICIMIMIFVNDGAAGYSFLEHATWDGLYVADLVFPWFLWIMGVCIPVSIKSQVKKNIPKLIIFKRIVIRSLKLIAIGIMLNTKGGPVEWRNLRLPGVLQRFGLCYLVSATTVLICANKNFVNNVKAENKYVAMFQDIIFIWKGWLISLSLIFVHTCLTFLLKVPGCPTGYLGPGGLHKDKSYSEECIGGAAGYIDRKVFTMDHIYKWPTAMYTYQSAPYDPEGLLGTLTSVFTVWLGVQAGLTLQVYPKHKSRVVRWFVWAVVTGAIAAALCEGKQTGGLIPLNKNLWSLSFVLTLSSLALILLIALYAVIDIWNIWSGTPFFEPGMNSILLYIGHSIANDLLPWHFRLRRMNTHFKRLVESLWGTSLWALYAIYLFHKKFFWSL